MPDKSTLASETTTLADIAKAAGVSIAAVSKALNEREGVSSITRDHVLQIASGLGYRKRGARAAEQTVGQVRLITYDRFVSSDRFMTLSYAVLRTKPPAPGLRSSCNCCTARRTLLPKASKSYVDRPHRKQSS